MARYSSPILRRDTFLVALMIFLGVMVSSMLATVRISIYIPFRFKWDFSDVLVGDEAHRLSPFLFRSTYRFVLDGFFLRFGWRRSALLAAPLIPLYLYFLLKWQYLAVSADDAAQFLSPFLFRHTFLSKMKFSDVSVGDEAQCLSPILLRATYRFVLAGSLRTFWLETKRDACRPTYFTLRIASF